MTAQWSTTRGETIPAPRRRSGPIMQLRTWYRKNNRLGDLSTAIICLLPEWMLTGVHFNHIGWGVGAWFDRHISPIVLNGMGVNFYFGGTSLLIVVGVAMDTVQQLEAQLVMRNYEGFARKGRIRGRR